MPWRTEFASDSAEIRYYGHTTGEDILKAKAEFFSHSFESEPRYVLCDFTGIEKFDVSPGDVRRIVQQDRHEARRRPRLVEAVVAPTTVEFGMSRMWELLVGDVRPRTAVRRTRPEVIAWLEEQNVPLTPGHRRELAASGSP